MKKVYLVYCLLFGSYFSLFAQSKSIKEAYSDFTVNRTNPVTAKIIAETLALYKRTDELTAKQVTSVAYHLGKMYEETENPNEAIIYYEQSLKGEPNYFVPHRALGFIYLNKSKVFADQMRAANQAKDVAAYTKAKDEYKLVMLKSIPHLEKYQACEPDDETLAIITSFYKFIKDTQSLSSMEARFKVLSEKCVSLLDDE